MEIPVDTAIHACVWGEPRTENDITRIVERAGAIGYDYVALPLGQIGAVEPGTISRICEKQGVRPICTCALPRDSDIGSNDLEARERGAALLGRAVRVARDMGAGQIGGVIYGPIGMASGPPTEAELRFCAEALNRVAAQAALSSVRLAVEVVNRYETNRINTVCDGIRFLDMLDHWNVVLHIDTFHMTIEEQDPIGCSIGALDRVGYFELDQSQRGMLKAGSIDLEHWLRKVAASGYSDIVGVEAFSRKKLAVQHANDLAIWRDTFDDSDELARQGLSLIRENFSAAR